MTERLARACAAHPRWTLALWGVAVVVAMALVATSLHGLTTQAHVIGSPQSERAITEIEKSFPQVAAQLKGDVILISSPRYTVESPQAKAFARTLFAALTATGQVSDVKFVGRLARWPQRARLAPHRERLRREAGGGRARQAAKRRRLLGRRHRSTAASTTTSGSRRRRISKAASSVSDCLSRSSFSCSCSARSSQDSSRS